MQHVVEIGDRCRRWEMAVNGSLSSFDINTMNNKLGRVCLPGAQHLPKRILDWPEDGDQC